MINCYLGEGNYGRETKEFWKNYVDEGRAKKIAFLK